MRRITVLSLASLSLAVHSLRGCRGRQTVLHRRFGMGLSSSSSRRRMKKLMMVRSSLACILHLTLPSCHLCPLVVRLPLLPPRGRLEPLIAVSRRSLHGCEPCVGREGKQVMCPLQGLRRPCSPWRSLPSLHRGRSLPRRRGHLIVGRLGEVRGREGRGAQRRVAGHQCREGEGLGRDMQRLLGRVDLPGTTSLGAGGCDNHTPLGEQLRIGFDGRWGPDGKGCKLRSARAKVETANEGRRGKDEAL